MIFLTALLAAAIGAAQSSNQADPKPTAAAGQESVQPSQGSQPPGNPAPASPTVESKSSDGQVSGPPGPEPANPRPPAAAVAVQLPKPPSQPKTELLDTSG